MSQDAASRIWSRPLNHANREIRLLELHPSSDPHENPRVNLIVRSLNSHPHFDAISHTWGSSQPSVLLALGSLDKRSPSPLWPVTVNLCSALQCFSNNSDFIHKHEVRLYWVDALCINQFDNEERRQQIALLRDIFREANAVRVWLGSQPPDMHSAVKNMLHFGRGKVVGDFDGGSRTLTVEDLRSIRFFFAHEWWQRLWVKQEVALARQVVFEHGFLPITCITLDSLLQVAKTIETLFIDDRSGNEQVRDSAKIDEHTKQLLTQSHQELLLLQNLIDLKSITTKSPKYKLFRLLQVLQSFRRARVSDPRDRVYAVLGMCAQLFDVELKNQPLMDADYSKDVRYIYTVFAYKLIKASKSLLLLNYVSSFYNCLVGLPSWVPDWSSYLNYDISPPLNSWQMLFAAGRRLKLRGEASPWLDETTEPARIGLKGHIIGTVQSVDAVYDYNKSDSYAGNLHQVRSVIAQWREYYQEKVSKAKEGTSDEAILEAFESVITSSHEQDMPRDYGPNRDMTMLDFILSPKCNDSAVASTELDLVRRNIAGRRFFVCSVGGDLQCPGLGPPDTQKGDRIALLYGGHTPYVLRDQVSTITKNPYLFSYRGECSVHGVMRGEQIPSREPVRVWLD